MAETQRDARESVARSLEDLGRGVQQLPGLRDCQPVGFVDDRGREHLIVADRDDVARWERDCDRHPAETENAHLIARSAVLMVNALGAAARRPFTEGSGLTLAEWHSDLVALYRLGRAVHMAAGGWSWRPYEGCTVLPASRDLFDASAHHAAIAALGSALKWPAEALRPLELMGPGVGWLEFAAAWEELAGSRRRRAATLLHEAVMRRPLFHPHRGFDHWPTIELLLVQEQEQVRDRLALRQTAARRVAPPCPIPRDNMTLFTKRGELQTWVPDHLRCIRDNRCESYAAAASAMGMKTVGTVNTRCGYLANKTTQHPLIRKVEGVWQLTPDGEDLLRWHEVRQADRNRTATDSVA